jgi:PAS domain S-box-containing protein
MVVLLAGGSWSVARTGARRKQAEEELQGSEERYRALIDLGTEVGEAIVMLQDTEQREGVQTFASDEWPRITGYSKEELLGMSFFDLVHPGDRRASIDRHRRKMVGESMPGLYELSILRKDGTEAPVELTSAYTTYKGQRANVVFIRDITARRQAEQELRRSESRLRLLSQRLVHSQEEERSRIARELHDQLGQELVATKIEAISLAEQQVNSSLGKRAWALVNSVERLIGTVHRTSVNLRPAMLDKLGFVQAACWYAKDFEKRTHISCAVDIVNIEEEAINNSKEMIIAAYRILQEALTNVLKHAKATQAQIRIIKKKNNLILCISDNGVGIDTNRLADETSLGLLGMRERALFIGGTVKIRSRPNLGTEVTARLPITNPESIKE